MLNRHPALSLTCIAIATLAFFGACDRSSEGGSEKTGAESVPVYFVDGHGLTAVYKELQSNDVTVELFELIKEGPGEREELRTFVPDSAELIATTETESDESLRLELNEAFWALPRGERFAAAAQIMRTYASLEEGKRLLLLDGTVPGELHDANGELLRQPLRPESFKELAPWAMVQQPVAGAVVRHSFPVVALLHPGTKATVEVLHNGAGAIPVMQLDETTVVNIEPALRGQITLRITVREKNGSEHWTDIPLEVAG